jgi:hypothetical protein
MFCFIIVVIIVVILMDYVMLVPALSLNVVYINICPMIVAQNMSILKCHVILSNMHYNYDYIKFSFISLTYSSWIYSTC